MKITVTMELTQENLSKLRALLPNTEIPGQVSMFDSPSEKSVEAPKTEAPAPEAEAPKIEDKPITKTDIRAVALKLSKAGKQKELADIFAKFGCKKHGRLSGAYERAGECQWLSTHYFPQAALTAGSSVPRAHYLSFNFRRLRASTPKRVP